MYLKRYEVSGFKNLTGPVVLEDLGPVNVLHGENNVGKSNVLQSIDWFFALLPLTASKRGMGPPGVALVQLSGLHQRVLDDQVFNLSVPRPIRWSVTVTVEAADLARVGIPDVGPLDVEVGVELGGTPTDPRVFSTTGRASLPSGVEFETVIEWLGLGFGPVRGSTAFGLVDTWRRVRGDEPTPTPQQVRSIIPESRLLALYDAREALDPVPRARWAAYEQAMGVLAATLGGGRFLLTFQRQMGRALLVYEQGEVRVPASLLGTGIQQVAALIMQVVTSDAAIVGVEEPELNLRYSLQLTLREMFDSLVGSTRGVRQLFLTSHSPAFEHGDHFYWMRHGTDGPTVEKRSLKDVADATAMTSLDTVPSGHAVTSYVTTEGLTRVPETVVQALHLQDGGPVYFHRPVADGPYQFLTEAQFFALWPVEPDAEPDAEPGA